MTLKFLKKKLGSLKNETIRVDNEVSYFFKILLKKNNLIFQDDPCKILKAKKK